MVRLKVERERTYTPFAPCVDDAVTKDEATSTAYEVTATKFLYYVRVRISALWTNETNCEIWSE